MISIISAFGGQHIQDALYKDMQGQNMVFSLEDCSNGISLIMAVEQHPDVDVIVIGHTVVKDIETYLSQIREITKTARIVLLLNGKRHQYIQEQYEGYNRRYNVEDIIFEGDGIDKLKILSIMNKGRLTVEQEIKEEIHAENPSLAEKPVEKRGFFSRLGCAMTAPGKKYGCGHHRSRHDGKFLTDTPEPSSAFFVFFLI